MLEFEFEKLIIDNNDILIKPGLTLRSQQEKFAGGRTDLIFADSDDNLIVVEIKVGSLKREHIGQIVEYWPRVKERYPNRNIQLMVIANDIPYEKRAYLERFEILFKEIPLSLINEIGNVKSSKPILPTAPGQDTSELPTRKSNYQSARYKRFTTVTNGLNTLALKFREDLNPPYYCMTWRSKRASSGSNRRFYKEKIDGYWSIPIDIATEMLDEAHARGLMSPLYHRWPNKTIKVLDSNILSSSDKLKLFRETLTHEDEDSIWNESPDTRIIACVEPWDHEVWRKNLILSNKLGIATFRSLTKDYNYKHVYSYGLSNGWRIDRSMLDADGKIFECYFKTLRGV